jgi:hypothetical protein
MNIINPVFSGGGGVELDTIQQLLNNVVSEKNAMVFKGDGYYLAADRHVDWSLTDYNLKNSLLNSLNTVGAIDLLFKPKVMQDTVLFSAAQTMGGGADYALNVGYNTAGNITISCYSTVMQWQSISVDRLVSEGAVGHIMVVRDTNPGYNPIVFYNGVVVSMTELVTTDPTAWLHTAPAMDMSVLLGCTYNNAMGGYIEYFAGDMYRVRYWNTVPTDSERLISMLGGVSNEYIGGSFIDLLTPGAGSFDTTGGTANDFAAGAGTDYAYTWSADGDSTLVQNVVGAASPRVYNGIGVKRYRFDYEIVDPGAYQITGTPTLELLTPGAWPINGFASQNIILDYSVGSHYVEFESYEDAHIRPFVISFTAVGGGAGDQFNIDNMSLVQVGCMMELSDGGMAAGYWRDSVHNNGDEILQLYSFANRGTGIIMSKFNKDHLFYDFILPQDSSIADVLLPDGYRFDCVTGEEIGSAAAGADLTITVGGVDIMVNAQSLLNGIKSLVTLALNFYTMSDLLSSIEVAMSVQANGIYLVSVCLKKSV